ncbi:type 1 glutamine amidotransferase domain-containing protein [Chitinasiproducens palmae]|uniref:Protease I n=1 Tax=Chitinasiproducens palmae TaxID=1770053 RepID=A0A1H2PMH2_9BURK|nr:type 1 glutamine amidotransferase domain-containing protein [Chitinasiproducens palmae]SDV47702.1 protease I [Chitinasiproducens palmae]
MANNLNGVRVAILATDGFEQAELESPKEALEQAGATVDIVSDKTDTVQGYEHIDKGRAVRVDKSFEQAQADDYDAVVLPGGVINGDAIRMLPRAQAFVKSANDANKPIAVICHGGWLPITAGIVSGKTLTSWPSLQDDLRNAGATWVDEEVHQDGNLISSRKPDDLPAFNRTLIAALQGRARKTA